MKAPVLLILTLFSISAFSQSNINNYKYVLVPERFGFSKSDDQYGLNTLTKALLDNKGFTAVVGNATLPPEVAANKCNALTAEVTEKKGIFVTNLSLQLKDCQGNVVFKSKEGKSREKEYHTAYNLALRDAFTSLDDVPYKYDGTIAAQPQQTTTAQAAPVISTAAPVAAAVPASAAITEVTGTLYAQPNDNGYQLIDTTPKKVLTLLKTSLPDHYIAEGGPANGVVFKKNEEWIYEYYKDNKLVSRKLQIKF